MIQTLKHIARVVSSIRREAQKRVRRSPQWPRVERAFLKSHPKCAACAGTVRLQVHHKKPFHLHPELELDARNLLVLCMGPHECHIRIGHGDSFKTYNPNVESDAAILLVNPKLRAEYEARAKASRLVL